MKIYGVTGWKNSGKTGLMERLIAEFSARGFSVSSIKHAHHTVDVDHPERIAIDIGLPARKKLSWQHNRVLQSCRNCGAQTSQA